MKKVKSEICKKTALIAMVDNPSESNSSNDDPENHFHPYQWKIKKPETVLTMTSKSLKLF